MSQEKPTKIEFVQNSLPPFEAGEYELHVEQLVSLAGEASFVEVIKLAVSGYRFDLKADEVVKVFPPDQTTGEYANVLPHIMLKSKTLPWERDLEPEPTQQNDRSSWLALLVFDQTDPAFSYPDSKPAAHAASWQGTVQDLFDTDGQTTISYFSSAKEKGQSIALTTLLKCDEKPTDKCQIIDVPIALFKEIAPTQADLPWLSHSQISKYADDSIEDQVSVLLTNRLPKEGSMTTVHLVSLEGMSHYLPNEQAEAPGIPATAQFIRLVSLHSWIFNPAAVKIHFATYLEQLNHDAKRPENTPVDGLFRSPNVPDSDHSVLSNKLKTGFIPFRHHLRTGDSQISWYRGPFSPQVVAQQFTFNPDDPFHLPAKSADSLLLFEKSTGLFTVSYAAAWQLGRLLALSNKGFATGLYQWKTEQLRTAITAIRNAGTLGSQKQKKDFYKALVEHHLDPDTVRKNFSIPDLPDPLLAWLSDLVCLRNVPFHYLLPQEEILTKESLKFFYLDVNWLACLLDGALSIGRSTQAQWVFDQAFLQDYLLQVLKNAQIDCPKISDLELSGFMWRSAAVKGWNPGIEVEAYPSAAEKPLPRVRWESLSPEVMIGVFQGRLNRINIGEPAIGTHFGIAPALDKDGAYQVELRYLTKKGQQAAGAQIMTAAGVPKMASVAPFGENRDTLNINTLALNIKTGLDNPTDFTAADFALEMIQGMEEVGFQLTTPTH